MNLTTINATKKTTTLTKSILSAIFLSGLAVGANAEVANVPSGEHSQTDVDLSQPIKALDTLTSLKKVKALKLDLPEFQHFTTSNGVPVIFVETHQLPIVDADLHFNAGSARDNTIKPSGNGLASMTSDMLGRGTKQLDENEFAEALEQLGAVIGSNVSKDQLAVSMRSLSDDENLLPALKLMNDSITQPRFDPDVLERNKAQLIVGLKQSEQNPSYIASIVLNKELFGNHPYAHSIYGTPETVSKFTVEDLRRFVDTYLVAQNATLNLTGDLSLTEAKKVAEILTSTLPKGKAAAPLPAPKALKTGINIHVDYDSDQTTVIMGQLSDAIDPSEAAFKRDVAFDIGNYVLGSGGFNSRLSRKVRRELGYTYGINSNMSPMQAKGAYIIGFSTRNEKAADAIDATLSTIDATLQQGVTSDEFALAKENLINSYPMGFTSNASINGLIGYLNSNHLPDTRVTNYIDGVKNTDIATVNKTLQQTITPDKFITVTVGRGTDAITPNPTSKKDGNSVQTAEAYKDISAYLEKHKKH